MDDSQFGAVRIGGGYHLIKTPPGSRSSSRQASQSPPGSRNSSPPGLRQGGPRVRSAEDFAAQAAATCNSQATGMESTQAVADAMAALQQELAGTFQSGAEQDYNSYA